MKVKVEVPAANGRKAYSYYKESSSNGEEPNAPKKGRGVGRALLSGAVGAGLVGAAAAGIGFAKKKVEEKAEEEKKEAFSRKATRIAGATIFGVATAALVRQLIIDGKRLKDQETYFKSEEFKNRNYADPFKGGRRSKNPKRPTDTDRSQAYSTLGLDKNATKEEVKEVWKNLSKKHHPDVNSSPESQEMMKKVNAAKDLLWEDSASAFESIQSAYDLIQHYFPDVPQSFWREDAQTEVKVPARNGRKGYSYFRNASIAKKGIAGAGAAIALGGLAAAAISMRKKPEESNALSSSAAIPDPAAVPRSIASRVGELAKKAAIGTGKVAGVAALNLAGGIAINKAASFAVKEVTKDRRSIEQKVADFNKGYEQRNAAAIAVEEAYEQRMAERKATKDREREAAGVPDRLPSPKKIVEKGGSLVLVDRPTEPVKTQKEEPQPRRFQEQDEWALEEFGGGDPRRPIMINGKTSPEYLAAVRSKPSLGEDEEAKRLARNIGAARVGMDLSPESKALPSFYTTEEIKKAGGESLAKQIERGEYLAPPDRLPSPNGVLPSKKPNFEIPRVLIPSTKNQQSSSSALTIAPSNSAKNSGSAIAEPKTSRLTQIAGSAGAALGKIYRKGVNAYEANIERDRAAREKLSGQTIDLNDLSRKAGDGARSTLSAVNGFTQRIKDKMTKNPLTIDVKAETVDELPGNKTVKGVRARSLPQGGKRGRGRPKLKFTEKDSVDPKNKKIEILV